MSDYIAIPLAINFDGTPVLKKETGDIERCISNILDLIVFTPKGSFSADPEFGFEYWNHEFSNIDVREFNNSYIGMMSNTDSANDISRQRCETSLRESILTYEPRLLKPEIKIELEINSRYHKRNTRSKYEMRILITGFIDDGLGVDRQYEKRISFMVEPVTKKIII